MSPVRNEVSSGIVGAVGGGSWFFLGAQALSKMTIINREGFKVMQLANFLSIVIFLNLVVKG
jgi:hypothetical protein